MKKTLTGFFPLLAIFLCFSHSFVFAQDPGTPDTVRFLPWGTYVPCPPCTGTGVVPVYVANDEPVQDMFFPLKWSGPVAIDTFVFVGERSKYIAALSYIMDKTGEYIYLWPAALPWDPIPPSKGTLLYLQFDVLDTGLVTIDLTTPIAGPPYGFTDSSGNGFAPIFFRSEFHIVPQSILPGDVNQDGGSTVSDVIWIVNYFYKSGPSPGYLASIDVNTDCRINIKDVIYFINYLFKGGPVLGMGCYYPH